MSDFENNKETVRYLSTGDILEIREEDTKPGRGLSERSRKALEEKYGRKPPASGPTEPPKEA